MALNMKLWIVGTYKKTNNWEIIGIYDTEEKAVIASLYDRSCFVGSLLLNETLPYEEGEWVNCYYPSYGKKGSEDRLGKTNRITSDTGTGCAIDTLSAIDEIDFTT